MSFSNPLLKRIITVLEGDVIPKPGSIVYRKLGPAEHTGIYIGHQRIIELDGSGRIEEVNYQEFCNNNPFCQIYVACDRAGNVLSDYSIKFQAESMLGIRRSYNVIWDNCHQFVAGCIENDFENANNFFWMIEDCIRGHFSVSKVHWRTIENSW
ncbi:hypothetical protein J7E73_26915 [Paenibacillus albidus]|uniref:hypothetical protein n=2 Tax=Paenibacillus TaxID=44249 RepID=UPI001BEA7E69|nr:hypothetical protein [Paenibacillus albidus]MBT2292697.1 hypothetical protein [Paenibacillus albidus]